MHCSHILSRYIEFSGLLGISAVKGNSLGLALKSEGSQQPNADHLSIVVFI